MCLGRVIIIIRLYVEEGPGVVCDCVFRELLSGCGFNDRLLGLEDESQILSGVVELLDDAVLCIASTN